MHRRGTFSLSGATHDAAPTSLRAQSATTQLWIDVEEDNDFDGNAFPLKERFVAAKRQASAPFCSSSHRFMSRKQRERSPAPGSYNIYRAPESPSAYAAFRSKSPRWQETASSRTPGPGYYETLSTMVKSPRTRPVSRLHRPPVTFHENVHHSTANSRQPEKCAVGSPTSTASRQVCADEYDLILSSSLKAAPEGTAVFKSVIGLRRPSSTYLVTDRDRAHILDKLALKQSTISHAWSRYVIFLHNRAECTPADVLR